MRALPAAIVLSVMYASCVSTKPYALGDLANLRPNENAFCAEHPEACSGSKPDPKKFSAYQRETFAEARRLLIAAVNEAATKGGRKEASVLPVGNTLFITAYHHRHKKVKELINALDTTVPSTPDGGK